MHTSEPCATLVVRSERLEQLRKDCIERACLDSSRSAVRVAMHGITLPHHAEPCLGHRPDDLTQLLPDLPCAKAGDENDLARHIVGVQQPDQLDELRWDRRWTALATNRIGDTSEVPGGSV